MDGSDAPLPASNIPRGLLGRRGALIGRGTRLPTVGGQRDLTLGGAPKKTFAPNVSAKRDAKEKSTSDLDLYSVDGDALETHQSRRDRGGHHGDNNNNNRGRGRGRGRGDLIQSYSIFADGPTDRLKPKTEHGCSEPSERSGGGGSGGTRVSIKREKTDSADTKRLIDDLLRDDFVVGAGVSSDDVTLHPVRLPMAATVKREVKHEVKPEIKVKLEPTDDPMLCKLDQLEQQTEDDVAVLGRRKNQDITHVESAAQLFCSVSAQNDEASHPTFVVMQLADVLPGEPALLPDRERDKDKTETKSGTQATKTATIGDFSEGYIGKIRVRRSGRTQLVLGNVALDVVLGTSVGFLQEVVCVRAADKTGDMSVLGHVSHNLIAMPDFDRLLNLNCAS